MRGKSHMCLGKYLIHHYMEDTGKFRKKLFLFGCIQPDRNPFTYLKGSLRCRMLCGHNYCNASRLMSRFSNRLQKRKRLNLLDYYTLGKLIHYTADSFTFSHNDTFRGNLFHHWEYEQLLQNHFLVYLNQNRKIDTALSISIMDTIKKYHQEYSRQNPGIPSDCVFSLQACCCIFTNLFCSNI